MIWLYAFLLAGVVCAIAQIVYEYTKLTAGHITSILVLSGVVLESFSIYDNLIKYCGGGATVLITNFGYVLAKASREGAMENGILGILKNILVPASASLAIVIVVSFVCAIFFKPKS